ncbi:hypothetical protein [Caulobacter sp. LARHSG274]
MTQSSFPAWCETLQVKLMAALDAVWAILETSDDPAEIRNARDKAKACGELAAVVRKVATMTGQARSKPAAEAPEPALAVPATAPATAPAAAVAQVSAQVEHAVRALEKLKGRRRMRF